MLPSPVWVSGERVCTTYLCAWPSQGEGDASKAHQHVAVALLLDLSRIIGIILNQLGRVSTTCLRERRLIVSTPPLRLEKSRVAVAGLCNVQLVVTAVMGKHISGIAITGLTETQLIITALVDCSIALVVVSELTNRHMIIVTRKGDCTTIIPFPRLRERCLVVIPFTTTGRAIIIRSYLSYYGLILISHRGPSQGEVPVART